ncbi:hypothetical protein BWK62_12250 [Flavobacterium oreochromis]|uniref:Uncharacterized protein n=1 Tax=Flavobacterium columnare TaxID=996 RepID=A0A246G8K4_9FLAO|nr:hypothetical protein BWG23_12435 [Flavobacterium oreochromis]OWP75305.1 hypothetical protein BWK62_12250 [Flavobacterium oreochromis]POR24158.1 hypothetical protein BWK58_08525 [Flavobacterium columnare]
MVFIFYVLARLELITEEIEDPFGGDENDLPIKKITLNIKKQVDDILLTTKYTYFIKKKIIKIVATRTSKNFHKKLPLEIL